VRKIRDSSLDCQSVCNFRCLNRKESLPVSKMSKAAAKVAKVAKAKADVKAATTK